MSEWLFDYLAARPAAVKLALFLLLAMFLIAGARWVLINPGSPYNQNAVPLIERPADSDQTS